MRPLDSTPNDDLEGRFGFVAQFHDVIPTITIKHVQTILCLSLSHPQLAPIQPCADQSGPPYRCKRLFGGQLWARSLETQRTEAVVKCAVLNRMTQLGMPETVRVG